jgi:hypothetical protein
VRGSGDGLTGRCIFARRADALEGVKRECVAAGLGEGRVMLYAGDVTRVEDLIGVRERIVQGESEVGRAGVSALPMRLSDDRPRLRE